MMVEVRDSLEITGVVVVDPVVHRDARGFFVETWRREWVPGCREMVQANRANRSAGSLVGLHYHRFQADYWTVSAGLIRVVLHDLRIGSPTEGATWSFDLGGEGLDRHKGVYIPSGVAHGFSALTDATVSYLVDGTYDPADELGLAWNDPEVDADWGFTGSEPVLSARDRNNPLRTEVEVALLPVHHSGTEA